VGVPDGARSLGAALAGGPLAGIGDGKYLEKIIIILTGVLLAKCVKSVVMSQMMGMQHLNE
jgi:hypothetical protein